MSQVADLDRPISHKMLGKIVSPFKLHEKILISTTLVILLFHCTFIIYNINYILPEMIPGHYMREGHPDEYVSKDLLYFFPIFASSVSLLFSVCLFDPTCLKFNEKPLTYGEARRNFGKARTFLEVFLLLFNLYVGGIGILIVEDSKRMDLPVEQVFVGGSVAAGIGAIMIILSFVKKLKNMV